MMKVNDYIRFNGKLTCNINRASHLSLPRVQEGDALFIST